MNNMSLLRKLFGPAPPKIKPGDLLVFTNTERVFDPQGRALECRKGTMALCVEVHTDYRIPNTAPEHVSQGITILVHDKTAFFSCMLDNLYSYCVSVKTDEEATQAGADASLTLREYAFSNMAFPVVRQAFPAMLASEIVSVQPMPTPVGSVFYLGEEDMSKDKK